MPDDAVHRGADFVAHHGEELALGGVGLFGGGAGFFLFGDVGEGAEPGARAVGLAKHGGAGDDPVAFAVRA